jgi:hypothetical protein
MEAKTRLAAPALVRTGSPVRGIGFDDESGRRGA